MRLLVASLAALGVLGLFFPVVCMQGEFDEGSCSSAVGIRLPGSADQAEVWQVAVLVVAVLLFVLIVRGRRARRHSADVD